MSSYEIGDPALANHLADATDAHDASAISILDIAADFTATEVEGALAELQTADEADEAALAAHLADGIDAHAGSAITNTPAGGIAATTVQAAINELDSEKQPLDADITAIAALADPNADRILFWDDSLGAYTFLTPGTGLTITGTTIDAAGGGGVSSCRVIRDTTFAHNTSGSWLDIPFVTESFDTDGYHDNATNNSRLTVPAGLGGKFLVVGALLWPGNATGQRDTAIFLNGTTDITQVTDVPGTFAMGQCVSAILSLSAGDFVELRGFQNSGGSLDLQATRTHFEIARLGA